jgi:hypothetical protein
MPPFTHAQFFELFGAYNQAIWPAQIAAYALGVGCVLAARSSAPRAGFIWPASLALLWGWTGAAYHIVFFATINPAAIAFGALFLAQAALFLWFTPRLSVAPAERGAAALVGWIMIAYAMAIYPLLNAWLGHAYPRAPSFGVTPCPLVIFTFGVLLLKQQRTPWLLLAAPLAWSVIGGSAAVLLRVAADWALPAAGLLMAIFNARKRATA